jgi:hypothetical protein
MKRLVLAALALAAVPWTVQADSTLSPTQLDALDKRGFLTPSFAAAARALIEAKQDQRDALGEQDELIKSLPDLQKIAATEESKVAALKAELNHYQHPDETDIEALRQVMQNAAARPEDQMAIAQAYVWTYPTSPHQTEAQQDLAQIQKKLADQAQAQKDADAAQEAAQVRLLQRVKARALSLNEWSVFLLNKTQTEVSEYLGRPSLTDDEHWTYSSAYTTDPVTNQKAGLQITFNGGRVLGVVAIPVSSP